MKVKDGNLSRNAQIGYKYSEDVSVDQSSFKEPVLKFKVNSKLSLELGSESMMPQWYAMVSYHPQSTCLLS